VRLPRAWLRAAGLAAVGATAVACASSGPAGGEASLPPGPGPSRAAGSQAPTPSQQATQAAALSPAQLAGQRVIFSYAGQRPPVALLSLIAHGEVAGVIFFSGNVASAAQLSGVIRQLDAADAASTNPVRAPLLLMTDQEGGPVRRLPGGPFVTCGRTPAIRPTRLDTDPMAPCYPASTVLTARVGWTPPAPAPISRRRRAGSP